MPGTTQLDATSPFSSRFDTNFIPNDVEYNSIKAIIATHVAYLPGLEQEMRRAESVYKTLLKQHERLRGFINEHEKLVAPFRRGVPDDVLQEIFLFCLPETKVAVLHPRTEPLNLSQVCVTWRRVAFWTPRLWLNLRIPIYDQFNWDPTCQGSLSQKQGEEMFDCRAQTIRRCLGLTKGLSMRLSLPEAGTRAHRLAKSISFPGELQLFKDVLRLAASGLTSLVVDLTASRIAEFAKISSLPLLEELEFTIVPRTYPPRDPLEDIPVSSWGAKPLFGARNLKKLSISHLKSDIYGLPAAWDRLTHLILRNTRGPEKARGLIRLLKPCTQLIYVDISPEDRDYFNFINTHEYSDPLLGNLDPTVSLPHLRKFALNMYRLEGSGSPFSTFTFPALEDVCINWGGKSRNPLLSIVDKCNLRKLEVVGSMFAGEELIDCLRQCPNLVVLKLSNNTNSSIEIFWQRNDGPRSTIDRTDAFLRLLSTPDEHGQILCPTLEDLENHAKCDSDGDTANQYTEAAILDFVIAKQSGNHGVAKLKRASFKLNGPAPQHTLKKKLEPYRKDGLRFSLEYSYYDTGKYGQARDVAWDLAHGEC